MVLGLVRPTAGSAAVIGLPYASLERPATAVGAVLEVQSFHPQRTGRNHLRVLAAASGVPDTRVDEVLALVDLTDAADRRAGGYSLGMRQRLGLAGALLGDPRVLILDEPANGLDPQGIRWLREFLREFAANGNAVLVSSHLLSEMAQMADEVIVIDRGRLVRQGSLADLTAGHASVRVAAADDGVLLAALIAAGLQPRVDGEAFVVTGAEAGDVGRIAAAEGIALTQLTAQESTLEDAFLELTEGAQR
jgi:ABC-2 type transport system ATP-binding protein